MSPGNGVDALVDELIVVHAASLPLPSCFAYSDAPLKIARHCLQMAEQLAFLCENLCDQLIVVRTAAASPARRQWRKRSYIATAELAPQPHHAADARCLAPQVAAGVVEAMAPPAGDRIEQVDVPTAPMAHRTFEPWSRTTWHWLVPDDRHRVPVDRKIGSVSGEPAAPVAPSELRHRAFCERAALEQRPDVQARQVFD
jgi:hypothetical protein